MGEELSNKKNGCPQLRVNGNYIPNIQQLWIITIITNSKESLNTLLSSHGVTVRCFFFMTLAAVVEDFTWLYSKMLFLYDFGRRLHMALSGLLGKARCLKSRALKTLSYLHSWYYIPQLFSREENSEWRGKNIKIFYFFFNALKRRKYRNNHLRYHLQGK